jgi:dTDP-3-amino-3,4,6-trideoxy-alpha-D-glucose transaminase
VWTQARRRIAQKYLQEIRNPHIAFATPASVENSVWHLFPVLVGRRDEFQSYLQQHGITTGVHYPRIIPDQAALAGIVDERSSMEFPHARRFARDQVSLPVHPFMTDGEVVAVITACNSWNHS